MNNLQKSKKLYLIYLFLFILIIFSGCGKKSKADVLNTREVFNQLTNEIFLDEVKSDSISLNYTLANPEDYGIKDFVPTFGNYGIKSTVEDLAVSENYLKRLNEIDSHVLTKEQKLTYDILKYVFTEEDSIDNMLLYPESLSPTLGIQAQLPVLLAEYNFHDRGEIDDYIELLYCTYDYFKEIINYEQEKSKAGLFMSDHVADEIIKQCNTFTEKREDNLLISVFNNKINSFPGLTKKERKNYKTKNKKAVLDNVIPAYELLSSSLDSLKGTGKNDGGLCNFPKGKTYYEYLVKSQTGSSKTIEELTELLNNTMYKNITDIQKIALANPDAVNKMLSVTYDLQDPNEILDYLKEAIKEDYPPLLDVNYTVKYVDDSLEEYLSPAFYLTPALDDYKENSIYINKSPKYDLSSIFSTLAHEGYPGHLYQCVYFNQLSPDPIRTILNFGGYSEGWATYVELESYYLAGFDKDVAALLEKNNAAILALYARVDIGVNYEGWTLDDTGDYLKEQLDLKDKETIRNFYYAVIEDPANYLKYTVGYLEFLELRNKAQTALKDNFNLKDFHEFVLKLGPAPFEIIEARLDDFIHALPALKKVVNEPE